MYLFDSEVNLKHLPPKRAFKMKIMCSIRLIFGILNKTIMNFLSV